MCDEVTDAYCNEDNGWCGKTLEHKNNQVSVKYDFNASCTQWKIVDGAYKLTAASLATLAVLSTL